MPEILIVPSSLGLRLLNNIIDRIATAILGFLFGLWIAKLNIHFINFYGSGLLFTLAYYTFMEMYLGQTLGKMATGTVVININGEKPTFTQVIIRSLCRLIPFEAFSFLGSSGTGWHDRISKTVVISKSSWLMQLESNSLYDKIEEINRTESEKEIDWSNPNSQQ